MNKTGMGSEEANQDPSRGQVSFRTPFDDLIPKLEDPQAQFYLDAIRIYLGLCEGTVTMEIALKAVDILKDNPEYTAYPTNPTLISINQRYKTKMLENLRTLNKFNLYTKSSIKSAYNFAFLIEESPVSSTDISVLSVLTKDPTISLVDASNILNIAPRTIARSLDRLRERNHLRISCLIDFSAFNLQSVMLFFTVQEGIEWEQIERGFTQYPFTKSILKTTMTDVGYVTFLIPNYEENKQTFNKSIKSVAKTIFDYTSLHYQTHSGAISNVDLFSNDKWDLPPHLEDMLRVNKEQEIKTTPPILDCSGTKSELKIEDYIVASQIQMDARAAPSKISESLGLKGIDFDSKIVSTITRKLQNRNLLLPYIVFALPKLTSSFCFEVTCNNEYKPQILETIGKFPWTMYYLSTRGIIVWTMTPGEHQVEYYQLFRALEQKPGVHSVNPIMTISQRGSKSMLDLTRNLTYQNGRWSVDPEDTDISSFMDF
ncbi:MAG: winged helix-turn-helix transcriptional regulator [Candidatus Thorarchaeota archaeon]|nr:winged helix-turn-helix transcriptional regulator [Candidatus Thorarchaeota archaeon]